MVETRCASLFVLSLLIFLCTGAWGQQRQVAPGANAPNTAFQRGLIALRDGHPETALAELTEAEHQFPSDARIRNFRGVVLVRLGKNEEGASEYREAVRLDPRMEDAYRNLGLLEWAERRLDSAREDLRQALTLAPDDSFAHYYLGRVLLDSKQYSESLAELKRSSVAWPEDPDFLIELAIAYNAVGQRAEAGRVTDWLLATRLNARQSVSVVDLLLADGRDNAAIQLLQRLQQPRHAQWARFDLAKAYVVAQKYENGTAAAREFIDDRQKEVSSADIAAAWSVLGIAQANLKNSDAAIRAFREASKLQPANEEHCLNLSRELMELDQYDEALSAIEAGLASNPKSYALHLRLGAVYLASGRNEDAEKAFRELVDANDPLPISYVGLAQVLLRMGRAEEAATEMTAAEHKVGPSFLTAYFRGLALKQAGKPDEAASAFSEAVQLNPSSAEVHRDLGSTLLTLGRVNEAIPQLKESLRLAPNDLRTRRLLSRAYARSGDVKTAKQYLDAEIDPPVPITGLQADFILPAWQYPP